MCYSKAALLLLLFSVMVFGEGRKGKRGLYLSVGPSSTIGWTIHTGESIALSPLLSAGFGKNNQYVGGGFEIRYYLKNLNHIDRFIENTPFIMFNRTVESSVTEINKNIRYHTLNLALSLGYGWEYHITKPLAVFAIFKLGSTYSPSDGVSFGLHQSGIGMNLYIRGVKED